MEVINKSDNSTTHTIYHGDNTQVMSLFPDCCIDLTVTSPPYDDLRTYKDSLKWDFDVFKGIAEQLYRITKQGGVVVWVVNDKTHNGSETGTSFKQALYFKELGFNLHDTMIYHKSGLTMNHNRYEQDFEYMFVFSKGKPKTFNPIKVPCKYPEKQRKGTFSETEESARKARSGKQRKPVGTEKIKGNIWYYAVGKNHSTKDEEAFDHPAIFPEKMVADHIISWSNENDTIFDPFMGSGTTNKMAYLLGRNSIGIEKVDDFYSIAKNRIEKSKPEPKIIEDDLDDIFK